MITAEQNADDIKADIAVAIRHSRKDRRKRFWSVVAYWLKHPVVPFTGARLRASYASKWGERTLTFALTQRTFIGGHELVRIHGHMVCVKCGGVQGDPPAKVGRCGTNKTTAYQMTTAL